MRARRQHPVTRQIADLGIAGPVAVRLARAGTPIEVPAGTTLCRHGERGTQAFLILAGTAQVLTSDGVVALGPGEVVGELATLDPHRTRNASVVAQTALEALVFDPATFRSLATAEELRPHLVPQREGV